MNAFEQGLAASKSATFVSGTHGPYPALRGEFAPFCGKAAMLWTIAVILVVLWLLGVVIHVGGGLIHLLLVIAIIVVLVRLFTGRRV